MSRSSAVFECRGAVCTARSIAQRGMNIRTARLAAVAAATALTAPYAAPPARAEEGVTTVIIAAATAGATALATLLVKDYFDSKRESERLERETEDILEEVKRIETRAEALEKENDELAAKIEAAEGAAEFWAVLIREDEEFFRPRLSGRVLEYEEGLESLLVNHPALVEKIHHAISQPEGDWERAVLIRAYGAAVPGADFWELKKRLDQGLEGGVVVVAGERQARYVSGAENIMAILDYVRSVAGAERYKETLERLWGCTPEEAGVALAAFPPRD